MEKKYQVNKTYKGQVIRVVDKNLPLPKAEKIKEFARLMDRDATCSYEVVLMNAQLESENAQV